MRKRIVFLATLTLGFISFVHLSVSANSRFEVKLERPAKSGIKEIDDFVTKSFDTYDESQKITEDINFIRIEGDGTTTPKTIKNGKGEIISKEAALVQFNDLQSRIKKQNDNIKTLQDLQKPAQESLKKCPMTQKLNATKVLGKGGEALNEVIKQTKTQAELIEKQIAEIKK